MQRADTITKVSLVFQTLLLFSVGLVFERRLVTAQMDIRFSHYISSCGYRSKGLERVLKSFLDHDQ